MYRPLIYTDLPDPDIICVGDTFYMVSTTMHMFPGGDIYRSRDLLTWELCCHIYDRLEETPARDLSEGNIYGKGMWAACLRFYRGTFHVFFVCNDTHTTCHYTAKAPEGPWQRHEISGFYHDCSVLFENEKAYIVYGNREIRLTQLNQALTGPLEGGIDQVILTDQPQDAMMLGFEGSHFYRIRGKYYLFLIHWPAGGKRTQACYMSDHLTGPYTGGDVLCEDMGFFGQGVAQGGIVQGHDGRWHALLFQDRGAVGRVPVLCDVRWENNFPVFTLSDLPECSQENIHALYSAEESLKGPLSPMWQFNHHPTATPFHTDHRGLSLALQPAADMEHARNTMTQRAFGPRCRVSVRIDASGLREGGRAGIGVLQGCFAGIYLERRHGKYSLYMEARTARKSSLRSEEPVTVICLIPDFGSSAMLTMDMDFTDLRDSVQFFADVDGVLQPVGPVHRLQYRLDHFMGVRIALYGYDTRESGSIAVFSDYTCCIQ